MSNETSAQGLRRIWHSIAQPGDTNFFNSVRMCQDVLNKMKNILLSAYAVVQNAIRRIIYRAPSPGTSTPDDVLRKWSLCPCFGSMHPVPELSPETKHQAVATGRSRPVGPPESPQSTPHIVRRHVSSPDLLTSFSISLCGRGYLWPAKQKVKRWTPS
ncbi:hypothetical protein F5883DRAFT_616902 [Diaporthe sp. PMI_573]|nr:hypothetical protein F5883DRAFT_616902 [Diaporthaceae sp. PMI_573]